MRFMRSRDIDELISQPNTFDKLGERLRRDQMSNTFSRMDELSAKMILPDQRHLSHIPQSVIDQITKGHAAEHTALAAFVRSETYKSIDQTLEAVTRMSFGREGQLDVLAKMSALAQSLGPSVSLDELLKTQEHWSRTLGTDLLSNSALRNTAHAAVGAQLANLDVLVARLKATDLNTTSPRLAELILEPTLLHTRFTAETIERLAKTTSVRESRALEGSLTLFNDQLSRLNTVVSPLITPAPSRRHGRIYIPAPDLDLPSVQQEELLQQGELPADATYDELAPLAPSSSTADDAIACIRLYERCNDARRFQDKVPIFTPTTRGTVAASLIPLLVADSWESSTSY